MLICCRRGGFRADDTRRLYRCSRHYARGDAVLTLVRAPRHGLKTFHGATAITRRATGFEKASFRRLTAANIRYRFRLLAFAKPDMLGATI